MAGKRSHKKRREQMSSSSSRRNSRLDRLLRSCVEGPCNSDDTSSEDEDTTPLEPSVNPAPKPKPSEIEEKEKDSRPKPSEIEDNEKEKDSRPKPKPSDKEDKERELGPTPSISADRDGNDDDHEPLLNDVPIDGVSLYDLPVMMEPGPDMEHGKYEEIRQRCLERNSLYVDYEFPANSSVLFMGNGAPYYGVEWKRPWQISKHPFYIKDGLQYPDIHQGLVGNCWFIATVATIAASPQSSILKRVIPRDQTFAKGSYCGAFRFYFWRYGKWEEVIIDDRLPTFGGKLIYAFNMTDPDEYWCPLLEKAYAKFHGNYHVLNGGRIHTAMVDLTGGLSEMIELKDAITDEELNRILLNCHKMNSLMGAAIFLQETTPGMREVRQDNGLYGGHAYSILNVKQVDTGIYSTTLLHMRNPWGKGEWNGAWSDRSTEWFTLSEADRKVTFKKRDDGEFWISLSDFRRNCDELELCNLTPDAMTKEIADNLDRSQWSVIEHEGSWIKGLSAGGPPFSFTSPSFWSNPQFRLQLSHATEKTTVIISLFRMEEKTDKKDISIGFVIFQLKEGRKPHPARITADNYYEFYPRLVATSGAYWPYIERTVRFEMDPAEHIIVPCTYRPGQQARFYMRVFSEGELLTEAIDNDTPDSVDSSTEEPAAPTSVVEKDPSELAIEASFKDIAGSDGTVDAVGIVDVFKAGLQAGPEKKHPGYNTETCRCLVALFHTENDKGVLDRKDVLKLWSDLSVWKKAFRMVDADESQTIDPKELESLFEKLDLTIGAATISTIMKRYGGKQSRISEEDFLQTFCRAMLACRTFNHVKGLGKISMNLDEWLSTTLV